MGTAKAAMRAHMHKTRPVRPWPYLPAVVAPMALHAGVQTAKSRHAYSSQARGKVQRSNFKRVAVVSPGRWLWRWSPVLRDPSRERPPLVNDWCSCTDALSILYYVLNV